MITTRLSTKGQVILPKSLREAHGWRPGARFALEEADGGVLLRPLEFFPPARIEDVAGSLKRTGKAKPIEAMKRGIEREVRRRRGLGRY
jgi:AbrB family looped-hinge helix DNA binding protein